MTWHATGLPAGMRFQQRTMMIAGRPAKAGTYHVTMTGHGSLGTFDTMTFKLVVRAKDQIRLSRTVPCSAPTADDLREATKPRDRSG